MKLRGDSSRHSNWNIRILHAVEKFQRHADLVETEIKLAAVKAHVQGRTLSSLPQEFRGELPKGCSAAEVFCGGCLVVQGRTYAEDPEQAARLAQDSAVAGWPLVVLHDDARLARSPKDFLWSTWTRFEPAADIYAADTKVVRHHLAYTGPLVIDARTKPGFPKELIVRDDIRQLVDRRWREYFANETQLN